MKRNPVMIGAENLRLSHGGREILNIESLSIEQGEVLAIVGPNGAGKSSLLLTLALLQPPAGGVIRIGGEAAENGNRLRLRRRMAVVFQEALLLDLTVQQNITTALKIRGADSREALEKAEHWMGRFGISHLARRPARLISGGEAQRTSLARAFALEPEVLFLDEPFASLDYPTRKSLLNELGALLSETKMTTLFVTHDYTEIPYIANRVAVLYEGRILREGNLREVFGEELLQCRLTVPWEI